MKRSQYIPSRIKSSTRSLLPFVFSFWFRHSIKWLNDAILPVVCLLVIIVSGAPHIPNVLVALYQCTTLEPPSSHNILDGTERMTNYIVWDSPLVFVPFFEYHNLSQIAHLSIHLVSNALEYGPSRPYTASSESIANALKPCKTNEFNKTPRTLLYSTCIYMYIPSRSYRNRTA